MSTENPLPEHFVDLQPHDPPGIPAPPPVVSDSIDMGGKDLRPPGAEGVQGSPPQPRRRLTGFVRRIDWRVAGFVLVAALLVPIWRAVSAHAKPQSEQPSVIAAMPVSVARVARQDLYNEVTFPAEFRPYVEVELHAKVSGYVREMKVDFGDRVKKGQLLATLEVPELQDELRNAIANQQKAEADYTNAHLIYQRLATVDNEHPNLVAQQELDTAEAKDRTTFAAIAAAEADVEKYQTLVGYTRITAPFDGVVTRRYADPGALIQAGTASDTQSLPLVRVSDNYLLRLDFPVDLPYLKEIHTGDPVEVRVESLGGEILTNTITRSMLRVDDATRKMTAEVEVPNPKLELVPGMYARVVVKVQRRPQALAVPTAAVTAENNPTVYLVNSKQEVEDRAVKLGLETPTSFEVLSGLKEGDLVLVGDRSKVRPGQRVEADLDGALAQQ